MLSIFSVRKSAFHKVIQFCRLFLYISSNVVIFLPNPSNKNASYALKIYVCYSSDNLSYEFEYVFNELLSQSDFIVCTKGYLPITQIFLNSPISNIKKQGRMSSCRKNKKFYFVCTPAEIFLGEMPLVHFNYAINLSQKFLKRKIHIAFPGTHWI